MSKRLFLGIVAKSCINENSLISIEHSGKSKLQVNCRDNGIYILSTGFFCSLLVTQYPTRIPKWWWALVEDLITDYQWKARASIGGCGTHTDLPFPLLPGHLNSCQWNGSDHAIPCFWIWPTEPPMWWFHTSLSSPAAPGWGDIMQAPGGRGVKPLGENCRTSNIPP